MQVASEYNFTNRPLYKAKLPLVATSTPRDRPNPTSIPPSFPPRAPANPDARRLGGGGGGGRLGRRSPRLPSHHLPPAAAAGRGWGGGGVAAVAGGGGAREECGGRRGGVAEQAAGHVLRGGDGGRAYGAPRVGVHRRAVGPARHRLRDQGPHEAPGPRDFFSLLPLASLVSVIVLVFCASVHVFALLFYLQKIKDHFDQWL